jgi:nicotinate-nucleotide pyrophosphorylase (carboxylating)
MPEQKLTVAYVDDIVARALEEDLAQGDITSDTLIPGALTARATVLVKAEGMLAGVQVVGRVFRKVDSSLDYKVLIADGTRVKPGDKVATISGRVAAILKGERTALNFIQRLSGIATQTALYVEKLKGTRVYVTDTRKTTPGLRLLEKYAVRMGGGRNHRMNLGEAVLIKDNHLAALKYLGMSLKEIVRKARDGVARGVEIEVEVTTIEEAKQALDSGVDIVMLDNMRPAEMRRAVSFLLGRTRIEASGGITLQNVREVAETGVTFISAGALTHSVKALDISLEIEPGSFKVK